MRENIERLLETMAIGAEEGNEEAQILVSLAVVSQADNLPEEMVDFHRGILKGYFGHEEKTAQALQE